MSDLPTYSGLKAVILNCSLKRDAKQSHTQLLLNAVTGLMKTAKVEVSTLHMADYNLPPGVYPDMTDHGYEADQWPELWKTINSADILIIGTPIWLGVESSICRIAIERLYAMSGKLNEKGQSIFYGKVGGVVVTGNEDGVKHCGMSLLYSLQHLGYVIPPQADCGWIGEIGPGPSFGDDVDGKPAGYESEFTQRNTTIMTWNLMHLAHALNSNGGIPTYGNDRNAWEDGERFGFELPARHLDQRTRS